MFGYALLPVPDNLCYQVLDGATTMTSLALEQGTIWVANAPVADAD
jgi:hypothetical protein